MATDEQIEKLKASREAAGLDKWDDYEIHLFKGDSYFVKDEIIYRLMFEFAGVRELIHCKLCGTVINYETDFMIRHRLNCGWK